MRRKNKKVNLGQSLIKDRFGMKTRLKINQIYDLHSIDMKDGFNWSLLNQQSVTGINSFQELLTSAELLRIGFEAEKFNIKFSDSKKEISSGENCAATEFLKKEEILKIPRRPKWDKTMTAEELQIIELKQFLEWKKELSTLKDINGFVVTPYEKNLEFWKQLWRVIERSDVIVQIVDARNPLLFRCKDLEKYVKEVNSNKVNMILINKADFLTKRQRNIWAKYFSELNIQIAFFSAISVLPKKNLKNIDNLRISMYSNKNKLLKEENSAELMTILNENKKFKNSQVNANNIANVLDRNDLISLLKSVCNSENYKNPITIGLVGYPNVGKSSIINALFMEKKVSTSATPGKTKHFQTLYLNKDIILCDSPGIVMPSIIQTKAEMILSGILPINQIQDYISPVNLLATLIPKDNIEKVYGIKISVSGQSQNINYSPTAVEILNAHGYNRGFMRQNGQPDNARSARYILNDFVNGKLLHCTAPPNYNQNIFHSITSNKDKFYLNSLNRPRTSRTIKINQSVIEDLDKTFFLKNNIDVSLKNKSTKLKGIFFKYIFEIFYYVEIFYWY